MRGKTLTTYTRWGLTVLLLAAICLWPALGRAACTVVEDGTYIEAEKYTTGGADWDIRTNTGGYNGTGYLQADDSDTTLPLKGSLTPVHYQLNFPSTGVYYIWFRGHDGADSGENSLWYGLDGTVVGDATTPGTNNNWNWTQTRNGSGPSPTRLNITTAGTHTIYVWPREDNFKFDGFYLRKTNSRPGGAIPGGATIVDPTSPICSGADPDNDGDGYPVSVDCNDADPAINPGASDNNCNGIDDNCNGVIDEGCDPDADGDGYPASVDCNDANPAINPGASDDNCNGIDDNCNGIVDDGCDPDADGDGYSQSIDCNDNNPAINPGATEICGNLLDDNCNGLADEGCDPDVDGDGYTVGEGDCDDSNPFVYPGAVELCDGIDNDCNGTIDHAGCDLDNDGYSAGTGDCNDNNANIHPGATEICDGIDNNCDGTIDEGGVCDVVLPPDSTGDISQIPLFLSQTAPPLNLLVLGRDHKLYYEAYNDASDLNGDGVPDVGYKPAGINYYGYFDSFKCYSYDSGGAKFVPQSTTTTKMCGGTYWSGDFLNYLTTSRIDALRKVLYGGKRSTDSTSATVLERSHIPQDAHSWGKEYKGLIAEGYDIRQYSPLPLPEAGYRHLFTNTTLGGAVATSNPGAPLLRVLPNSRFRAWEWVSIERPVAGSKCLHGVSGPNCENSTASSAWEVVPSSAFSNLTMTTWNFAGLGLGSPGTHAQYDTFVNSIVADAGRQIGSGAASRIDGTTNPFSAQQDNYLSIFSGKINIPSEGTWTFAVDGDDAIEVMIDGTVVAHFYGAHSACNCQIHSGSIYLTAGAHDIVFRHEEHSGDAAYRLYWQRTIPVSQIQDYTVRVEVCKPSLREANCKTYPNSQAKPTGLLHEYGEDERMKFGLLTGSYTKNTSGGVLRKGVSSFTNEVNSDTGQFTSTVGIVKTIDRLRTVGFDGGSYSYNDNCGWITTYSLTEGKCRMWGNPVAEMMYEGLRYFAGKGSPTSAFTYSNTSGDDFNLGLPLAAWDNPYASGSNEYCAKPFQLVISDINPSYDSDQLPGSYFGSFSGDVANLDVGALGSAIWDHEFGAGTDQDIFIGQSGTTYDGSPTVKSANSFRSIRGLTPEEPTKQGSYYAGSIAYFGQTNDINAVNDIQKMNTFTVALASPLPQIKINAGGQEVILVPFAKSVAGSNITTTIGSFQPTNTIVDYYIDSISATSGRFRINFEDVEQGADHDMDAIAEYHYQVNADNTVTVTVTSVYAAGGIAQHMGYVISGTTNDGVYLVIRDCDTANSSGSGTCSGNDPSNDPDFFLDTPPGQGPGGVWTDAQPLPLASTRTFTPASSGTATFLKNPLWYAAKYGKFKDLDGNDLPDAGEWDEDANGTPDNYFLVTNALTLSSQLGTAFNEIIGAATSAAAIATNSTRLDTDTLIYQARFNSGDWSGQLLAFPVKADGTIGDEKWDAGALIPADASRNIFTLIPSVSGIGKGTGTTFAWANLDADQQLALDRSAAGVIDGLGADRLAFIRGARGLEKQNSGPFRDRSRVMGDIVNSDPLFVGLQNYGYNTLPDAEGTSYLDFRLNSSYRNRTKMLYFGANDGMLHGINANTGEEVFAYVPNAVIPYLNQMTSPSYEHRYTVDGLLGAGDVFIDANNDGNREWRTVLVGTLGAGGKGLFALDVTDPANFSAANVLWEITPDYTPDGVTFPYADLGFTLQQPYLVRMANGKWAVVIGNGYPATATSPSKAVLYVIDAADGSLIWKLAADSTAGNGLSGPAPIDLDGNRVVDHIYAGDLKGNLWRFDVGDASSSNWDVAFRVNPGSVPKPLYTARGPSGQVQPITARPEVGLGPKDVKATGVTTMIYFGTGKYFGTTDNVVPASPPVNTFYGILDSMDNGAMITATDRSVLVQQSITAEPVAFNRRFRVTTTHDWDHKTQKGWFMDLVSPVHGAQGERVVDPARLNGEMLIFTTIIPSSSTCEFGGSGWLMEVSPLAGGRPEKPALDVNNDGLVNDSDKVDDGSGNLVNPSAEGENTETAEGIITSPGIIDAGDKQYKFMSTSSGLIKTVTEANTGANVGRGSWRQLR